MNLNFYQIRDISRTHVSVHEENLDTLTLVETHPPQFTPQSKYYCTKTVRLREGAMKSGASFNTIDTKE